MLTIERQELILALLKEKEIVSVHHMCEETGASESTIRRDLTELENKQLIKRVHGGASLLKKKREEPTLLEKTTQHQQEKELIAKKAVTFVDDGDSIYLDAGTTTMSMIPHLADKSVVVVTNGIPHVQLLIEYGIETYVIGGKAKKGTAALIGTKAVEAIGEYRFDKCFLGINGIHMSRGFTTPDPEEANVKQAALRNSQSCFVLADPTKFGEVSFANVANIDQAAIITTEGISTEQFEKIAKLTTLEVIPQ
ncbi:transcriptional regulator, DeoR family [Gracilibacillus ureilyticus]|uniref:Transcriptional regulator, DeoR family n=1 Tax=Gracilibacillus ureilyticus TaxID=531814 RepID=A0A1H9MU66_9BACI|nr:DeoR/GlpR family DNA-binding transcription regulator [Gracilibacillus ureilyticus]SER27019.1 transcriptional regulator, DeoR family [Gracilibacillus ureilyticus]